MQCTALIKQILDINKKAIENSFDVMAAVQEHAEKMVNVFWQQSSFFPEEGKKVIGDWVSQYKTGFTDYRENVDKRFKLVENYFLNALDQMDSSFSMVVEKTAPENQEYPVSRPEKVVNKKAAAVNKTAAGKKATEKK
jgi:polyhydroxyalkanoate synthesis regulator phasin